MSKDFDDLFFDTSKIKNEVFDGKEENKNIKSNKSNNKDEKEFNFSKENVILECYIDKIKEEENQNIGFDFNLLERDELHVNLIHFDSNMTNSENYGYFSNFKVDVVGGFQAIDDIEMLKKYLEVINTKNIPFIVISSGSSGTEVIPICKKYSFIKEVIIFCGTYKYNEHYLKEYPGYVKKVFTNINDVYNYIKSFGKDKYKNGIDNFIASDHFTFSLDDINMDKQLEQCPVISAFEYDKCYFLVHRAYAHFFKDIKDKSEVIFDESNFKKIEEYINKSIIIKSSDKQYLIKRFESIKNKKNFAELSIRAYTGESGFCYIFNRTMRNFEKGLISLAYYMGPLLFALNKYIVEKKHEKFKFNKNMTLYRVIHCSIFDFYLYKMNLKHIICFPSITSTSTVRGKFTPTPKAQKYNNNGLSSKDMLNITMIFNYKYDSNNISPGIIVKDYKASDGKYLSSHETENEVLLFPFTFARIIKIKEIKEKEFEIYFDIINRDHYIEYDLRDNVEKRFKFSSLD